MAVSHVKSDTIADFTGTITGFNSQGSTTTIAATDLVRPVDWNSAHNQFYTLTGNTNGNSTASGTNVLFAGSGGITVGGSTGTIVISAAAPFTQSGYHPYPDNEYFPGQVGQGTLALEPERFPDFQCDRILIPVINTNSSNSSGSHTVSFWAGIYTRNVSTLSLLTSYSTSTGVTHSGTAGSYSLYSGLRLFSIPATTTFTAGQYWLGFLSRTTSGGANGTYSNLILSNLTNIFAGHFGVANNTTMQFTLGQGIYSATTSSLPGSIGFNQIRGSDAAALRNPIIMFASSTV